MIVAAMVLVLASLFSIQAQSEQIKSQVIYSSDHLDGFAQYMRGGQNNLVLNKNLKAFYSRSITANPFVTFKLSEIDIGKAKSITLHVYQIDGRKTINIKIDFWQVVDTDYRLWQNCQFTQFGNSKEIHIKNHVPENCGFSKELNGGTWYDLIRYETLNKNIRIKRNHQLSWWWHSDDFKMVIEQHFKNKQYLTIALYPDLRNWQSETAEFADGKTENGKFRPYLEITY